MKPRRDLDTGSSFRRRADGEDDHDDDGGERRRRWRQRRRRWSELEGRGRKRRVLDDD